MRTNLPVTQNEVQLHDDSMIVSKTDLKGRITYVNKDFLDISGFTEAELIGEPHNIVRHPDMPTEAFKDLWETFKAGRPWIGMVKNRCKNGDYYWVEAHAAPIYEAGQVVGYMSVRRKPRPEQVRAAEESYARFRAGEAKGLTISLGRVVSGTAAANPLAGLTIAARMWALYAVVAVMLVVGAAIGLSAMSSDTAELEHMYKARWGQSRFLSQINSMILDNSRQVALAVQHAPDSKFARQHDHTLAAHTDAIEKNIEQIGETIGKFEKGIDEPRQLELFKAVVEARGKFVAEGLGPALAALKEQRFDDANLILLAKINPHYAGVHQAITELQNHLNESGDREFKEQVAQYEMLRNLVVAAIIAALVFAAVMIVFLKRLITQPMEAAREAFKRIAQGDYTGKLDISRNDEAGKVLQGLEAMQVRLGFDVAETKRQADEMTRVKIALDCVGTPVRIADARGTVIYANKALFDTLRRIEPVLKAQNPAFSVDGFVGSSIGNLYADPQAALGRLASLTGTTQTEMDIGGRTYRVVTSPVFTGGGERLGSVGEWQDRTDEMVVEREVAEIVDNAARGNLDRRINLAGKTGFFAALSERINGLLGTTHEALMATSEVLGRVARGDLTQQIDKDYEGIFGRLKDDTNTTVERLREVVGRIKEATEAINTAAQEIAAGNQDLSSRTEEQASSLEETASSMEQLNATVKQNAESARQANALAMRSNEVAARGGAMVKQVVDTMTGIQASSKKIADIVGVIDSIAFQTNILALNAAVEAARAGEQGRGFAVVATEVRNLAQRSATAAREIKALIAESVDKVEGGAQLVNEAGTTMDEVVTSFRQVAQLVVDISNASREQSGGIEQVTQAVSQMDEVTQQNAALVEQAAAAAESLEEQARGLVQAVGMFKLETGTSNLPGPALRDATPRRLAAGRPGAKLPAPGRKVVPPHLVNEEDEWEEF